MTGPMRHRKPSALVGSATPKCADANCNSPSIVWVRKTGRILCGFSKRTDSPVGRSRPGQIHLKRRFRRNSATLALSMRVKALGPLVATGGAQGRNSPASTNRWTCDWLAQNHRCNSGVLGSRAGRIELITSSTDRGSEALRLTRASRLSRQIRRSRRRAPGEAIFQAKSICPDSMI